MNERIKELMLKAGYAAPEIAGRAQTLVELVVRECAEMCLEDNDYKTILRCFGVEE